MYLTGNGSNAFSVINLLSSELRANIFNGTNLFIYNITSQYLNNSAITFLTDGSIILKLANQQPATPPGGGGAKYSIGNGMDTICYASNTCTSYLSGGWLNYIGNDNGITYGLIKFYNITDYHISGTIINCSLFIHVANIYNSEPYDLTIYEGTLNMTDQTNNYPRTSIANKWGNLTLPVWTSDTNYSIQMNNTYCQYMIQGNTSSNFSNNGLVIRNLLGEGYSGPNHVVRPYGIKGPVTSLNRVLLQFETQGTTPETPSISKDSKISILNASGSENAYITSEGVGYFKTNVSTYSLISTNAKIKNLNVTGNFSAKRPYGSFFDNNTQAFNSTANTQVINISQNAGSYLIFLNANNITFSETGNYLLEISILTTVTTGANKHIEIYPQLNGVDIPNSNTRLELSLSGVETLIAVPFIVNISSPSTDYVRLMWYSDTTASQLLSVPPSSSPTRPGVPSVIATITKISEITTGG